MISQAILTFSDLQKIVPTRLECFFEYYFKTAACPAPILQKAMAYGVMNGGKRIRPLLVHAVGQSYGASAEECDIPAAAIELIHAYSLVHDDLPAMDDADLRRGKPSCHKHYNEALAILVGDALQTLAFEILAQHPGTLTSEQRLSMVKVLTRASGYQGMCAGQALDIEGIDHIDTLEQMYGLKTSALLSAALELGAIAARIIDTDQLYHLKHFACCIGLAFQLQDDLLDLDDQAVTGKPQHLDTANNKMTYARTIGTKATQAKIHTLFIEALTSSQSLGENAYLFEEVAYALMGRKN